MEEVFDIYTRNGEYIGTELKSICHSQNPRGYHKPVWIWIINSNNEILVQKRAANKKNHPNKWDMLSAGHEVAGETSIQGAIRETFEELGIQTKESDYKFVFEYIQDKSFEIAQVYLFKINLDISKLNLQKEEVSEVKWISYEEFKKMFYSNEFVPFDNEYKEKVLQMMLSNFS